MNRSIWILSGITENSIQMVSAPVKWVKYYYANKTVARRCCSLVSSIREHYLVALIFKAFRIPISANQNSAFQR